MPGRLKNIRVKGGYKHLCSECGSYVTRTDMKLYPSVNVFCSKECEARYYSIDRLFCSLIYLISKAAVVILPWMTVFLIDNYLGWTGLGLIVGILGGVLVAVALCWFDGKLSHIIRRHY